MKVLVANPSIKTQGFLSLEQSQLSTWMSKDLPNVKSFFYYGGTKSTSFKNRELHIKCNEGIDVTIKTLKMFEYCLDNFDFDFIFRTNLSSYVNLNRLYKYCKTLPQENIYQGHIGVHQGIKYASGSGILLSKDVVKIITSMYPKIEISGLNDDTYIGKILSSKNIAVNSLPRFNYQHNSNINSIKKYHNEDLIKNFHYRCKTFDPFDPTRKTDCERIKLIHQTISKEKS